MRTLDAHGNEYLFKCDDARNLTKKTDPRGNITTYQYDELNRRELETQDPQGLNLVWQQTYDANGNPLQKTDPNGHLILTSYGLLERLASVTYAANGEVELPATTEISYGYDGNGNVLTVDETKETVQGSVVEQRQKFYDARERLESVTRYDGQVVSYTYDEVGNRLTVTDPGGVATTYTYDAQNRLHTAEVPGAGTTTYALSPDGLALGSTRPGVNERRCYDAGGRLETIVTSKSDISDDCVVATPISRFDYAYDANGNRVSQTEQRTDPGSQSLQAPESTSYGYDDLDRLTSVLYPDDRAVFYGLDPVGNRLNECESRPSIAGAITTLALCLALAPPALALNIDRHFDAGDRLIQRVDHLDPNRSQVLGYDPNGNRISEFGGGRSRSYAWDVRNTLTSVSDDGLQVGRYDYDPELQRVKRSAQGLDVEYVLDDHFVLLETAPGGTRVRRYHSRARALPMTWSSTADDLVEPCR